MRKFSALAVISAVIGLVLYISPALAYAQDAAPTKTSTTDGLTITPLRTNPTVKAGEKKVQKITVQNRTAKPMSVVLTYEEFSLTNESYEYSFSSPKHELITFEVTEFRLDAGAKRAIAYQIEVPANYPPGGYYFTLFATNIANNGSIQTQSRVGSLVFLTVDGTLDRTTRISSVSAPSFSVRTSIPLNIQLENTGNVHSEVTVETSLHGPATSSQSSATHFVMPGTTRSISYQLPAPRLPGIYSIDISANNGYDQPTSTTVQVFYLPLWFIMTAIGAAILVPSFLHKRRSKKSSKTDQNVSGTAV